MTTAIEPDTVHLWRFPRIRRERIVDAWRVLDDDERARARRFAFAGLRRAYVSTHAMVRTLLGSYVGSEPSQVRFVWNRFGKPGLIAADADVRFNLTHSGHLAVLAVTVGRDLGVDLELMRAERDLLGIAGRYFSPSEVRELRSVRSNELIRGFYNCWTRKEAYIKGLGEGLAHPLDSFDVSLAPGGPAALRQSRSGRPECDGWTLRAFDPGSGYTGALAVRGVITRVSLFDLGLDGVLSRDLRDIPFAMVR